MIVRSYVLSWWVLIWLMHGTVVMEVFQTVLCWTALWATSCTLQFLYHTMDGRFLLATFHVHFVLKFIFMFVKKSLVWFDNLTIFTTHWFFAGELATRLSIRTMAMLRRMNHGFRYYWVCLINFHIFSFFLILISD